MPPISAASHVTNTSELSKQMGHSQVATTIDYLRDVIQTKDLATLFSKLGKNGYKAL